MRRPTRPAAWERRTARLKKRASVPVVRGNVDASLGAGDEGRAGHSRAATRGTGTGHADGGAAALLDVDVRKMKKAELPLRRLFRI